MNEENNLEGFKLDSYQFIVFDISDYKSPPEPEKKIYTTQIGTGDKLYEVWSEGYAATGEHGSAFQLTLSTEISTKWKGDTFQKACINALKTLEWDMKGYYSYDNNSYWACRFFDNEKDARKSFG